jgi:N6-L-threonylcarbamoyladenine synthase
VHVLGLESSCDETAAAVVHLTADGRARVVSDVVHSQVALHAEYGGVVPELASRDHLRNVAPVVKEALARAQIDLVGLAGIAVTNRPGLVGALLVGVQMAKALAWSTELPFVGVDHLVGHLLAVFLERDAERAADGAAPRFPSFPYAALLASGGHTALYRVDAPRAESIVELGATRDDAAGEAFDKVAKLLGLAYPGGPIIDRLAAGGDPHAFAIPVPMNDKASLEFSFSGVKTWIARHVAEHGQPGSEGELRDLCASFQAVVTGVLTKKLFVAAQRAGIRDVVIGGGVAANRELRRRVSEKAASLGMRAFLPSLASCTDNAAMIAYAGSMRLAAGERDGLDLVATSATALPRLTRKGRGLRAP